jgi:type IV pilus biogenesis/stability protein PilW
MTKILALLAMSILVIGCSSMNSKKTGDAKTFYEAGTAALVQGDYTDAIERLRKAIELNPEDPYSHNNLALAYQVKKFYKKSEKHFKIAISLKDKFSDAENNLGALYIKMKRWDEAIKSCKKAAKNPLYRTPEKAYSNIGRAYYKKKKYKLAMKYQRKAIASDQNFCYAYANLGQAQMRVSKYKKASKALRRSIDICKTYEAPYFILGMNFLRAKKKNLARKQFNVLVTKFPKGKYRKRAKRILKVLNK